MRVTLPLRILACFLALVLTAASLPLPAAAMAPETEALEALWGYVRQLLPREPAPEETLPGETVPGQTLPAETVPQTARDEGYRLYFGQLHGHSDLSDGTDPAPALYRHAAEQGLDFFALTDRSDYFDAPEQCAIGTDAAPLSRDWAAGKAAAAEATGETFLGIFGYEMSWPRMLQIGHIGTFATPGFQSWRQEGFRDYDGALDNYYAALASVPGAIGQFNHPGPGYGSFAGFSGRTPEADRRMTLLEVDLEAEDPCRYYLQALEQGWHVSPTCSTPIRSGAEAMGRQRTAVYAHSLTEEGLYEALRSCRTYATADPDLGVQYTLNGAVMGSRIHAGEAGGSLVLSFGISDPTDGAQAHVEVVGPGGAVLAEAAPEQGTGEFVLETAPGYYFLRITQPDGDLAITAPVWVEGEGALTLEPVVCETELPVQNEPVTLALTVKNEAAADFLVGSLEILADDIPAAGDGSLTVVPAGSTLTHRSSFSCDCVGLTRIRVRITGSLGGEPRTLEGELTLNFHQSRQITAIAVDASHNNAGLDSLGRLEKMALDSHIRFQKLTGQITGEELKDYRFLLLPAPGAPYSGEFLAAVQDYAAWGGSVLVCGQADTQDTAGFASAEQNRLLEALGVSLRLYDDVAVDPVNNGGSPWQLYTDVIDRTSPWCAGVTGDQVYRQSPGCTVDPGGGEALVRGRDTTFSEDGDGDGQAGGEALPVTLLAAEPLEGGGTVFAAGSLFCSDEDLREGENLWALPYANRTITAALLQIGGEAVPLSTVAQARAGRVNSLYRVRGYVTAGTSNPYNAFPDTLYLQDETGGIGVIPFNGEGIQQGTAVEVTAYAAREGGCRILKPGSWRVLEEATPYAWEPAEGGWPLLLEPVHNEGRLVQVEGTCLEISCREDGTLAGCLLRDEAGNLARISVEETIGNGSDGINDLHLTIRRGRRVRAAGILHVDRWGDTVIRVRNCEEVVWVPQPRGYNPQTADPVLWAVLALAGSLAALLRLRPPKRPYRGRYLRKR